MVGDEGTWRQWGTYNPAAAQGAIPVPRATVAEVSKWTWRNRLTSGMWRWGVPQRLVEHARVGQCRLGVTDIPDRPRLLLERRLAARQGTPSNSDGKTDRHPVRPDVHSDRRPAPAQPEVAATRRVMNLRPRLDHPVNETPHKRIDLHRQHPQSPRPGCSSQRRRVSTSWHGSSHPSRQDWASHQSTNCTDERRCSWLHATSHAIAMLHQAVSGCSRTR